MRGKSEDPERGGPRAGPGTRLATEPTPRTHRQTGRGRVLKDDGMARASGTLFEVLGESSEINQSSEPLGGALTDRERRPCGKKRPAGPSQTRSPSEAGQKREDEAELITTPTGVTILRVGVTHMPAPRDTLVPLTAGVVRGRTVTRVTRDTPVRLTRRGRPGLTRGARRP